MFFILANGNSILKFCLFSETVEHNGIQPFVLSVLQVSFNYYFCVYLLVGLSLCFGHLCFVLSFNFRFACHYFKRSFVILIQKILRILEGSNITKACQQPTYLLIFNILGLCLFAYCSVAQLTLPVLESSKAYHSGSSTFFLGAFSFFEIINMLLSLVQPTITQEKNEHGK